MRFLIIYIISVVSCFNLSADTVLENSWVAIEHNEEQIHFSSRLSAKPMAVKLTFKGELDIRDRSIYITEEARTTCITLEESSPFVTMEMRLNNSGKEPLILQQLDFPVMSLQVSECDESLCTLGSGGWRPHNQPQNSYTYHVLADNQSRNGVLLAWLTQKRGVGLLLPKYLEGEYVVQPLLDFGKLHIKPGQFRETDTLLIGFHEDVRMGLEQYADTLAKLNGIVLPTKPNVYCTWYHRQLSGSGASTEAMLRENAVFAREHLQPFGLDVLQIDDHWQALEPSERQNNGPVKTFIRSNKNYPEGMAHAARMIEDMGFTAGIWYMPFAGDLHNPVFDHAIFATDQVTGEPFEDGRWSGTTIDVTSPEGEAFFRQRVRRIQEWGYRYIKVDGLHIGTPSHNIYVNRAYEGEIFADASLHDTDLTFVEAYQKGLGIIREETPGAFILGCSAAQNMVSFGPVFGYVDAMRVGPDNDRALEGYWGSNTVGADYAGNLWFLNNRVWYNDPDPIYVRESNPLHKARWMASWLAVSGAMNTTSMQYSELSPERLNLIKRTLPAHNLPARPVDILEREHPQIWKVEDKRMTVLCLLNWDEANTTKISYPLDRMGFKADSSYAAFDYWNDQYLGTIEGSLVSELPGAHCQVLAVREVTSHPQLLSTSRHITQGLIDVIDETWDNHSRTLQGTSKVVAGDPYELRITCPPGYAPIETRLKGIAASIAVTKIEPGIARILIEPSASGELEWSVDF